MVVLVVVVRHAQQSGKLPARAQQLSEPNTRRGLRSEANVLGLTYLDGFSMRDWSKWWCCRCRRAWLAGERDKWWWW